MVKETGRFVVRHGPENRTLDTAEIRAAFALSETWAQHVKRFRDERVARVLGEDSRGRAILDRHIKHLQNSTMRPMAPIARLPHPARQARKTRA